MGAICSKPGTHRGGHRVIGTTRTLGSVDAGGGGSIPPNPRQAALKAAERRQQEVRLLPATYVSNHSHDMLFLSVEQEQRRGTNEDNPNAGKLSGQLATKNASRGPEPKQPDRLVVSTRSLDVFRLRLWLADR